MPVWASALITVIAALGSGTLGAWLASWNDRRERFRDRMIDAADEFGTAAAQALVKLRDAIGEVRSLSDPAQMKEKAEGAWAQRDAVLMRSARIDLLFGPGSETARSSTRLLNHLANAVEILSPPKFDPDGSERALLDTSQEHAMFCRVAFDDIRRAAPPSARLRESLWRLPTGAE